MGIKFLTLTDPVVTRKKFWYFDLTRSGVCGIVQVAD
jgi:hypothetical protein